MNRLVIIGTLHPGVEAFLADYFSSLRVQTCRDFDLLLANDGLVDFDSSAVENDFNLTCIDVDGSISENRRSVIRHALEQGYRRILFTDCDDMLAANRVEASNRLLERFEIVVNDLDLVDGNGIGSQQRYFSRRFGSTASIDEDTIRSGNLMGLSNTAARAEVLRDSPALERGDSIAFDWYLWAACLHQGRAAGFSAETTTRYRIYENNTAGLPQAVDETMVHRGVEVKRQHYRLMSNMATGYDELYREFDAVSSMWPDLQWRDEFVSRLKRRQTEIHMWWENIRPPSEVGMV